MVENDPNVTDLVRKIAKEVVGEDKLKEMDFPITAGEDFSAYQHKTPGCYN